jgi:hypothetical protein
MFFLLSLKGCLYTSCVLRLRPSALFNDILIYQKNSKLCNDNILGVLVINISVPLSDEVSRAL